VTVNRHVPALRAHGGFDIVALVDPDGERAHAAAKRLGVDLAIEGDSADALNTGAGIEAILAGVPPPAHYAVARSALDAGLHALVEKPFTMRVDEAEELIAVADDHQRALAVMQNFALARSTRKVQGWIAEGRLGPVRAVWAIQLSSPARRLPTWYDDLPFGLFYDESPNLIALARLFAGTPLEPRSVQVRGGTRGGVTPAQVDVALDGDGVSATLLMNFESPVSEWQVVVVGERAVAAVDLFRDVAIFTPGDNAHMARDIMRTSAAVTQSHWAGVVRSGLRRLTGRLHYGVDGVVARFHSAIANGEPLGPIDARHALETTRLQHWVLAEAGCGSASV
jgi:predicted dehydrogenase